MKINFIKRGKFYHCKFYMHDHLCGVVMFTEDEMQTARECIKAEWVNDDERMAA